MMRTKTRTAGINGSSGAGRPESGEEWEMRPGGMLVQKRNPDSDRISGHPPPLTIRVRVKHGSTYHEISINSQATFGELKKMLTGPTGLHHQDQKLIFKDKERDSNAFLDMVGVKDRSKMVLVEDPISQEKRLLEMRRTAKMEKASKSISEISLEIDRLAGRVSALDSVISRGGKVAESDLLGLIELLMNQLLKLDAIIADGDVKLQRKMQVRRVQKYVETLDMLKIKNSMSNNSVGAKPGVPSSNNKGGQAQAPASNHQAAHSNGLKPAAVQPQQQHRHRNGHFEPNHHHDNNRHQQQQPQPKQPAEQPSRHSTSATVVTTQWEIFDSAPALVPAHSMSTSTSAANNNSAHPKFNWEFFE